MSQHSRKNAKNNKKKKSKKISIFRVLLIVFLIVTFISAGIAGGLVLGTIKNAPKINPVDAITLLNENSIIVDKNGNLIEKVQTEEFRTIVGLDKISNHLENAVIAIEDERFRTHIGIDPKRIVGALIEDIKARALVEGASTITQQLVRNIYLTKEKKFSRKIKEAYLAIELERDLTKDQILKTYLNTIYLGQGAYGVQEAAQTYFSKNASELTLAESAMIAGITKHPSRLSLYKLIKPSNYNENTHHSVGNVEILGKKYVAIFNEEAVKRQRLVLSQMKRLGMITEKEYNQAINEDMKNAIKPGWKRNKNIQTSYFIDYVKQKVIKDLINKKGYTQEQAERQLYTGGLKIYSTMNINMQKKLETAYNDFSNILINDLNKVKGAALVKRSLDKYGNIVDKYRNIAFYKEENIVNKDNFVFIEKGTYTLNEDGSLTIKNNKINYRNLDIIDYYTIDENKNLHTHSIWNIDISKDSYTINEKEKSVTFTSNFLINNDDFYKIKGDKLLINPKYYYIDTKGIVQPQSSMVIIDYKSGEIKALIGGRNIKGNKLLNRATDSPRQPGSSIKPIAVYLPALDNGFTAATVIDDIPHYDSHGNLWPSNWYGKSNGYQRSRKDDDYKGLVTLREAVEQSINVIAVKVLERVGIDTSVEYLTSLGIIDPENPQNDSFITRQESSNSDEDLAPLALGGMRYGISPLRMTAAYGAIANEGIYTNPIVYTKVEDRDGNIILENKPFKNTVVTPQVSYLMTDILRGAVTRGTGSRAQLYQYNTKIPVAGKTGTTQKKADAWFLGYTPYYVAGVWIGNDNQAIKLDSGSKYASMLWGNVMREIHKDLEAKDFVKPQGFVTKVICKESGKLVTDLCKNDPRGSTARTEIFIQGTEPREFCEIHVEADIDTRNNKLATEYTPPEFIERKVFIKRDPPYIPEENQGYIPMDFQYSVPTEVSDAPPIEQDDTNNWFSDWLFNNSNDEENEENIDNKDNPNDNNSNINNNQTINDTQNSNNKNSNPNKNNKDKNKKSNDIMNNVDKIIDNITN